MKEVTVLMVKMNKIAKEQTLQGNHEVYNQFLEMINKIEKPLTILWRVERQELTNIKNKRGPLIHILQMNMIRKEYHKKP